MAILRSVLQRVNRAFYRLRVVLVENPMLRFQLSLLTLAALIGFATIGYMVIEGMNLSDSLYMTMITITTVGFGEVQPLSNMGRLFTISLLLLGVTAATNAISSAAGLVMGPRLWDSIRKMRMERLLAEEIRDHYIVCGYGRMGRQVTRDLIKRGEAFVLIDAREELEEELLEDDIPYVIGNATRDDVLLQAGIKRARGLVTALDDDPDNIMTVLTARELNPSLFIVARVSQGESERKLLRAGANRVVSPYQIGGHRIALALIRPAVNDFLDSIFHFERGLDVDIGELYIHKESPLVGRTVGNSGLRGSHRVTILAINQPNGEIVLTPDIDMPLEAGCTLIVIGPPDRVYDLEGTYPRPGREIET